MSFQRWTHLANASEHVPADACEVEISLVLFHVARDLRDTHKTVLERLRGPELVV